MDAWERKKKSYKSWIQRTDSKMLTLTRRHSLVQSAHLVCDSELSLWAPGADKIPDRKKKKINITKTFKPAQMTMIIQINQMTMDWSAHVFHWKPFSPTTELRLNKNMDFYWKTLKLFYRLNDCWHKIIWRNHNYHREFYDVCHQSKSRILWRLLVGDTFILALLFGLCFFFMVCCGIKTHFYSTHQTGDTNTPVRPIHPTELNIELGL